MSKKAEVGWQPNPRPRKPQVLETHRGELRTPGSCESNFPQPKGERLQKIWNTQILYIPKKRCKDQERKVPKIVEMFISLFKLYYITND